MLISKRKLLLGLMLTVSLLAAGCGNQRSSEANSAADAQQTSAQNSAAAETASGEDASTSAVVYP